MFGRAIQTAYKCLYQRRTFASQKDVPIPKNYDFRPPYQKKMKKNPEVEYWHNQREQQNLYWEWTWTRARFAMLSAIAAPLGFFWAGSIHQQNQAVDMTGNVAQEVFGLPSREIYREPQEMAKELFSSNTAPDSGARIYTYYWQQFWPKGKRESRTEIL